MLVRHHRAELWWIAEEIGQFVTGRRLGGATWSSGEGVPTETKRSVKQSVGDQLVDERSVQPRPRAAGARG
jgi:hypothetical protein